MADPRRIALQILCDLDTSKKSLDLLMEESHEAGLLSDRRDRAMLQALVYGVLRWRAPLDAVISGFSKKGLTPIEPAILNVLRLGVFQLMYLDRIPPSAAVNTSVELAKSISAPWTVKFVNAVLRKAASAPLSEPSSDSPSIANLALAKSFPKWLLARWVERFGREEALRICDAANTIPPITLRANTLRTSREALFDALSGRVESIEKTSFAPEGISIQGLHEAISDFPEFLRGEFQVQDEAAQLVGHILGPKPGETVMDACAGLGGKTGHLGQLMENEGALLALDHIPQKLLKLSGEMVRLGITRVTPHCQDLSKPLDPLPFPQFDRILLDAPCSGAGVLRRNPDGKWSLREKDLLRHQKTQLLFLHRLSPLVKPSGILVYAVCSTEPEENEAVIEQFLSTHPEFQIAPLWDVTELPPESITEKGFFRSYPHCLAMDGFFAARITRLG